MATIKHRLKKQLPAEISGARRSQGWMELEEISKDTGEVSESCCRRLVLVGWALLPAQSQFQWHKGVFSSLFKVLKGSLKSRTLMVHGNKVHFFFPAPSKKATSDFMNLFIYFFFPRIVKKATKLYPTDGSDQERKRHFWSNSSMSSSPSPYFVPHYAVFKYEYFFLFLKYFPFLAPHSLPRQ